MSDWPEVQSRILQNVFFNFHPDAVVASRDLAGDGFVDSLSVIGIVTTIDEHLGGEQAQSQARREDFLSLDTIKGLYLRLVKEA
jgi:hypothetical protein